MFECGALDFYVDRLPRARVSSCVCACATSTSEASPPLKPSLRKIEGFLVCHDRRVQKLFLRVKTS